MSLLDQVIQDSGSEAWQQLVATYTPALRKWIDRYGVQDADANDLLQEVLLAMSTELPNFQHSGRPGAFRNWLRQTLTHRLQNHWRSRKYRPEARGGSSHVDMLSALAADQSEASRLWDVEHDQMVVAQILQQIRSRFQSDTWEAFRLVVVEGKSASHVAAELGIPVDKVYVAKSRVLNAARTLGEGLVDTL